MSELSISKYAAELQSEYYGYKPPQAEKGHRYCPGGDTKDYNIYDNYSFINKST